MREQKAEPVPEGRYGCMLPDALPTHSNVVPFQVVLTRTLTYKKELQWEVQVGLRAQGLDVGLRLRLPGPRFQV